MSSVDLSRVKQAPMQGMTGMWGGVGSNLVSAAPEVTAGEYVDNVFNTQAYDGTGTTPRSFTTGLDMATHGGLVWFKNRTNTWDGMLIDSERGLSKHLKSQTDEPEGDGQYAKISSMDSNGFTIGSVSSVNVQNEADSSVVAWSWRKCAKFFDVVTYTGNGSARTISHSLGSVPKFIVVKRYSATEDWICYHVSKGAGYGVDLGSDSAGWTTSGYWNDTTPTASVFSLGTHSRCNGNATNYVAYLFADDTAFGAVNDDNTLNQICKMGSYTGNGNSTGPTVSLGFEPQWIIIKNTTSSGDWLMFDTYRSIEFGGDKDDYLTSNTNAQSAEAERLELNSDGFQIRTTTAAINENNSTFIYYAIRRPDPKVADTSLLTAGDKVFTIKQGASSAAPTARPTSFGGGAIGPDAAWAFPYTGGGSWLMNNRFMGNDTLSSNNNNSVGSNSYMGSYDYNNGFNHYTSNNTSWMFWMWMRWQGFDTIQYRGNGVNGRAIPHSMGQSPEMIWIKDRTSSYDWQVWHKDLTSGNHLYLNSLNGETTSNSPGLGTVSATTFNIGSYVGVNSTDNIYMANVYSSVAGKCKVGSYSGNSSGQTITCGFQPRFMWLKRYSSSDSRWYVLDTVRGWASGNDQWLGLSLTGAQSGWDFGAPTSTGFTLTGGNSHTNADGNDYIFYAHA